MGFCNPTNSASAVQQLTSTCASLIRDITSVSAPPEPAAESPGMNLWSVFSCLYCSLLLHVFVTISGTGLWDLLDNQVLETKRVQSAAANATAEVQLDLTEPNIPCSEDPIQFLYNTNMCTPIKFVDLRYSVYTCFLCAMQRVFLKASELVSKKINSVWPQ